MTTIINTSASKKVRLFIATDCKCDTKALSDCVPADNESSPWRIKRIPAEQWHLTWLFLGQTDPAALAPIQTILAGVSQRHHAIVTQIQGICWWPSPSRAMGLALRLEPSEALAQLATDLKESLTPLMDRTQLKANKAFNPHITIARLKPKPGSPRRKPNCRQIPLPQIQPQPWSIQELRLYQSQLTDTGSIYQCLFSQELSQKPL